MGDQIYIGNFAQGLTSNRLPFNIDNDAFPTLYNSYVWRGRVKRKRGTIHLDRLQRQIQYVSTTPKNWQYASFNLSSGAGNLLSHVTSIETNASVVPASISITVGANTYTDANSDGTLQGTPAGSGTINYSTGAITIVSGASGAVIGTFSYYPSLPVMGLEDYVLVGSNEQYPLLLAMDTKYSYQLKQTAGQINFYNVNYYKSSNTPFTWTGDDFNLFWTTNYSAAFWATNNKSGFHFQNIATISVGSPTTVTTSAPHGLITNDYVWFNEITGADANLLNGQTAIITVVNSTTFTVAIDTTGKTISNNGLFQMLTSSKSGQGGIKWYDGDMTATTGLPTSNTTGWVNFAPPLSALTVSINNTPAGLYYLVGALAIVPFKDRLLFFSPTIQTSTGAPIPLVDTVIWSWNGTPYYSSLTPAGETSDSRAYYVDQTGFGGYLPAGISQPIATVSNNEDVLLVGFGGQGRKTRFAYTGNDLQPFLFYNINSELPSSATFSSISLDKGAIDMGVYGFAVTDQQSSQRIDLVIPTEVFTVKAQNNGLQRVNAIRDFYREWIYFSYPVNTSDWKFPTQTFMYNYRDNAWSILYENYTVHGNYRKQNDFTWATLPFNTWEEWSEPWNSSTLASEFPSVVAGNPQGYVCILADGTGEAQSGCIEAISTDASNLLIVTSTNHCVREGDYLYFQNALGTTAINQQVGRVVTTADANTFKVDLPVPAGTYGGLGTFARLSQPTIKTKQFPGYWQQGRQTILGHQKYLLDRTDTGQATINMYLSQDPDNSWNDPQNNVPPNSLVYSQVLYTCPESANIGLSAANTNLQTPTANTQRQIWHRFSTSMIGESVQLGLTLSDAQMRNYSHATDELTLHGVQLNIQMGPALA